ncbi:hypothetical protein ACFQVC_19020 [Streptomyces monticola]|uniref:Uncharacterized protein n=1 Tax=Streptomyces monticola TaxID=2666263 RepID=A0ABW2JKR2_9ACTN
MGPPPKKSRTGLIVTLSIVGFLILGAIGTIAVTAASRGEGPSDSYPEAKYRLTLPQGLLGGDYTLAKDLSGSARGDDGTFDRSDAKNWKGVAAMYSAKGGAQAGGLTVSGMYGQIRNPEGMRNGMMRGGGQGQNATVAVPAEEITPAGSDGLTVSCQVLTMDQGGNTTTVPMCAWADENTAAVVSEMTSATVTKAPEDIDLEQAAARALEVREQLRRPIG